MKMSIDLFPRFISNFIEMLFSFLSIIDEERKANLRAKVQVKIIYPSPSRTIISCLLYNLFGGNFPR
jgi:hypothetical protein